MAPLLPQDLLDLILDRLGAQMDYESLCRCALAHRSMRERSQQLLFAELRVTVPEFVPADQNRRARTLPERLLATLEKTPRLSQYIRILLVVSERPGWDGLPVLLHGLSQESALPRLLPGLPLLHTLKLVALSDDRAPELGDALVDALLRTSVVELGLHNVHAPDRLLRTLPPRLRQLTLDEVIWGNTGISEMPPDSCHDPLKLVLYGGEIPIEFTLIPFARTNTRCIVDLDLTYVEHLNAHAWRMLAIEPLWKLQCITFGCYPNLVAPDMGNYFEDLRELKLVLFAFRQIQCWHWMLEVVDCCRPLQRLTLFIYGGVWDEEHAYMFDEYLVNNGAKFDHIDIHLDPTVPKAITDNILPLSIKRYGADRCLPRCQ